MASVLIQVDLYHYKKNWQSRNRLQFLCQSAPSYERLNNQKVCMQYISMQFIFIAILIWGFYISYLHSALRSNLYMEKEKKK